MNLKLQQITQLNSYKKAGMSIFSSANNKSPVCSALSHNLRQWKNSDQNTEMVNAGLDSSILSPFLTEAENNLSNTNRDVPPADPDA